MELQLLIAGFGGQGVLLLGTLLAKAAMMEGREVSWMPSYGPEMRGGEAHCAVVVSDEPIGSPLATEPGVLVALNRPGLVKFMPVMPAGGLLLHNASLTQGVPTRDDIRAIPVPCNDLAETLQNGRLANMIMLGAIQAATKLVGNRALTAALVDWLGDSEKVHPIEEAIVLGRGVADPG